MKRGESCNYIFTLAVRLRMERDRLVTVAGVWLSVCFGRPICIYGFSLSRMRKYLQSLEAAALRRFHPSLEGFDDS